MKPSLVQLRALTIAVLVSLLLSSIPPLAAPPAQALPRPLAATATGPAAPPDAPSKPVQTEAPPVPHPEPPPDSLPAQAPIEPPSDLYQLPLAFVPNQGQTDDLVRFQVHTMGGTAFFTADELVLTLPAPRPPLTATTAVTPPLDREQSRTPLPQVLRQRFDGANRSPQISGVERLPGVVNYLLGNDRSRWRTEVPTYAGVSYRELYPGIDLHYGSAGGLLKSTYTLAPGADPTRIRWRYAGAADVRLDDTGALRTTLPLPTPALTATTTLTRSEASAPGVTATAVLTPSTLVEQAPLAWQDIDGRRVPVAVRYVLTQDKQVGFALGTYDRSRPLTIDPVLTYGSYLGGDQQEYGRGIAVDPLGRVYVVGTTFSTDFPDANALQASCSLHPYWGSCVDIFVTKLDATGKSPVYSTFIGGKEEDEGFGIAADAAGYAYVTGYAGSIDFPTTAGAWQLQCPWIWNDECVYEDAFVLKLTPDGSQFVYNTMLGGGDHDQAYAIAIDASGAAYVTGRTWTTIDDLPPTGGAALCANI